MLCGTAIRTYSSKHFKCWARRLRWWLWHKSSSSSNTNLRLIFDFEGLLLSLRIVFFFWSSWPGGQTLAEVNRNPFYRGFATFTHWLGGESLYSNPCPWRRQSEVFEFCSFPPHRQRNRFEVPMPSRGIPSDWFDCLEDLVVEGKSLWPPNKR